MKEKTGLRILLPQCLIFLYGFACFYLYRKQLMWVDGSVYESDLPAHLKMILEDGWYYSFTAFIYKGLALLPFWETTIPIFLALCTLASVYLTDRILGGKQYLLALALNLVMPCYIRGVAEGRYIGMQAGNIWHNSTYLVMKCLGLVCLIFYWKLQQKYKEGLNLKEWGGFAFLLFLTTGVKPSFLLVFAPVMALFLLADFIRGASFRNVLIFGTTVFPSLFILLFQNSILFGAETGNGIEFNPGYTLTLHSLHPLIASGLSVLFPLAVFAWKWKDLRTDRAYLGAWLMAGFGFLQLALFTETGNRAVDGNFMWGYSFALFFLFVCAAIKWQKEKNKVFLTVTAVIFLCHLYQGLNFFVKLVQGTSYWMWD